MKSDNKWQELSKLAGSRKEDERFFYHSWSEENHSAAESDWVRTLQAADH